MVFRYISVSCIALSVLAIPPRTAAAAALTQSDITAALAFAAQQATKTIADLNPAHTTYPRSGGDTGPWTKVVGASDWTSGFFPWELTSLYRATGNPVWLSNAIAWTAPLAAQASIATDADVGMRMLSTGALYSLTGDQSYKTTIFQAASSLASRYSSVAGAINHVDAFPGSILLLQDSMNNLAPLSWAGANGGDPAWSADAAQHALTTAANLPRPDGSTNQLALFDPVTGARTFLGTYQGYSDSSDWQRGLTWAMNGYADLYYQTKNTAFLASAQALADHYLSVVRNDCVPYWDARDPAIPAAPIDTSAAALADLALIKLGTIAAAPADQARYGTAAQCGLKTLIASDLAGSSGDAVLLHGNNVGGRDGANVSLIFGDAAFVAALAAQQDLNNGLPITWTMSYDLAPINAAGVVPEPAALLLFASGMLAMLMVRRRL